MARAERPAAILADNGLEIFLVQKDNKGGFDIKTCAKDGIGTWYSTWDKLSAVELRTFIAHLHNMLPRGGN